MNHVRTCVGALRGAGRERLQPEGAVIRRTTLKCTAVDGQSGDAEKNASPDGGRDKESIR